MITVLLVFQAAVLALAIIAIGFGVVAIVRARVHRVRRQREELGKLKVSVTPIRRGEKRTAWEWSAKDGETGSRTVLNGKHGGAA